MKTIGSKRIAERYVRALFEVTAAGGQRSQVEGDFIALQTALSESAELRDFLGNPLLTREQQASAMETLLGKMKAAEATCQFVAMLARQRRLEILPDVISLYCTWAQAERGEISAELITATALSDKEISALSASLGKAVGKKIHLNIKQDASLLGGVVVKIGSQQLDSSLSGKLERLSLRLKAA